MRGRRRRSREAAVADAAVDHRDGQPAPPAAGEEQRPVVAFDEHQRGGLHPAQGSARPAGRGRWAGSRRRRILLPGCHQFNLIESNSVKSHIAFFKPRLMQQCAQAHIIGTKQTG